MMNSEKMLEVYKNSKAKLEAAHKLNETITSKSSEYISAVKLVAETNNKKSSISLETEVTCPFAPALSGCREYNKKIRENNKTKAKQISDLDAEINAAAENRDAAKKIADDSTVDMTNIFNEFKSQFSEGTSIAEMISFYEVEITELEQQIKADSAENEVIQSDSYLVDQDGHGVEEDYTY